MATILLVGVDLFFRGKLEGVLSGHHLITVDNVDPPDPVVSVITDALRAGESVAATAERIGYSERQLHRRCRTAFGYGPKTLARVLRMDGALRLARSGLPLADVATEPKKLLVTFLAKAPDRKLLRDVDPAAFEPDVFAAGKREIYTWCPNGVGVTKLGHAFWEKHLQVTGTGRNWNTVTNLLAMTEA